MKVHHILVLDFEERTDHIEVLLGKAGLIPLEFQLLYSILNSSNLLHQLGFFSRLVESPIEARQRGCRTGKTRGRSDNSGGFAILF